VGCAWGREFRWRREGVSWGIIKMRKSEREPEEREKKKSQREKERRRRRGGKSTMKLKRK
jgi:hypothetical protein